MLSDAWPYPMGMAGWQLAYKACPAFDGPPPLFRLPLGAAAGGLFFPYYSTLGELGAVHAKKREGKEGEGGADGGAGVPARAASVSAKDVEVVMIVQHGASRNADDYFCSGVKAAALQTSVSPSVVGVIAPRFMEPQDAPPANTTWWNGTFPFGYWRAGAESDPRAAQDGKTTVSSFAILDRIIDLLRDPSTYVSRVYISAFEHSNVSLCFSMF
jgi:hypothetical protein